MIYRRITPSGAEITFEDGLPDPETGKSKRRTYWLGEQTTQAKVPSITTVLGVIEKEGMHHVIEKMAVDSCIDMARDGGLPLDQEAALGRMTQRGLRFRQQWSAKADKGTVTHDWLVRLMADPSIEDPPGCEPFAKGIREWLAEHQPEAIQSEVMVASTRHRFAGRFDLLARLPKLLNQPDCRARIELKTTSELSRFADGNVKPPYTEHLWQLAAQELAAVESGDPGSEVQAVLRVDEDAAWDFHITQVEPRGFLASLALYRALRGIPEPESLKAAA